MPEPALGTSVVGMVDEGPSKPDRSHIVIAGGGVAGVEAALALADLAAGSATVELLAPEPDFLYKPLLVEEPFTGEPPTQLALEPLLASVGTELARGRLTGVDPAARRIELEGGGGLGYDILILCLGGRTRPAYPDAVTFAPPNPELDADDLVDRAAGSPGGAVNLIVPPTTSWALPLYELALLLRRRAEERGHRNLPIRIHTPEQAPLAIFGVPASEAVTRLLDARRIGIVTGAMVPVGERAAALVGPGAVLALPLIEGPRVSGLPCDDDGFLPIDAHCRVPGAEGVYAAGDGTSFPVKQGGIATQQADAAAEHIAASLGERVDPSPFSPVLRGMLLTGADSLYMRHRVAGGGGEGTVSGERLWWPPDKISGRYLSAALAGVSGRRELEDLKVEPLEVEVSLPREWHAAPPLPWVGPPQR